ncbi:unnamed protein product [Acanthoscelides obtectus]|uniref:NADH dehydrogenase [ubiquinone] 1 beta subcomplex subunit 6 n=1 Tax=Acanthoscelides obtectus TaxID=200917 RepID=A0A9P0P9X9_ACAOB|nr:unnamed protein product [Acanthoscelides obtectus]CAK1622132.1 hypothetical protein AOBTE_LOCUS1325 [Acanthoscelides obtectus]
MGKASDTGGVKPMAIAGRYVSERERVLGMTDEERAFRKQWLKDQELSPNEPRKVPEMYKATFNPIRRFYRWPLDKLAEKLTPIVGEERAIGIRWKTGKILMGIAAAYYITYYFKYNRNDWMRKGGWRVIESRQNCVPGDPGYPMVSTKSKGADYDNRNFNNFKLNI